MVGGRRGARRAARRTVRRVDRRQDARTPEPEATETPPEQAPTPHATEPAAPDLGAQLEQLAKLKEQGLISEADYEAKKKQILGI